MLETPTKATKSILLDYISPSQPATLVKAFRNQHYLLAASVVCSLLLRLLVTLFTGLITLSQFQVEYGTVPDQILDLFSANKDRLGSVDMEPRASLEGIIFYNASYPEGTDKDFAFPRFSAPDIPPDASIQATIDGFAADLDCQPCQLVMDKDRACFMNLVSPGVSFVSSICTMVFTRVHRQQMLLLLRNKLPQSQLKKLSSSSSSLVALYR